ncbi:hypothetical protein [Actinoallomurus sp. NPDC050550]|uniref:hypothetical protein n=1 Tax=Actinoallomurus sp. NPDC050550 TaxID=3154937 RepID=UPI0033E5BA42
MTEIENRLVDAYEAATSTVRPEALRALTAPPARRRRRTWAAPLAVAAALILISVGVVALTGGTDSSRPDPALIAQGPKYLVAVREGGRAEIVDAATGRKTADIPTVDGKKYVAVAAGRDEESFFLGADTTEEEGCAGQVYRVSVRANGTTTSPVLVPGGPYRGVRELAVSPHGTRLAVAQECNTYTGSVATLTVIDLNAGTKKTWNRGSGGVENPTWAPDDRTLGYLGSPPRIRPKITLLDTGSGGGDVWKERQVRSPDIDHGKFKDGQINAFVIDPDGRTMTAAVQGVKHGPDDHAEYVLAKLSVETGEFTGSRTQALPTDVFRFTTDVSGRHVLVLIDGRPGRLDDGRFSWIPKTSFDWSDDRDLAW